jgi:hypothetical protein
MTIAFDVLLAAIVIAVCAKLALIWLIARRTFRSASPCEVERLARAGVPLADVFERVPHIDPETIAEIYNTARRQP